MSISEKRLPGTSARLRRYGLAACGLLFGFIPVARAQTIHLRDGQTVQSRGVRRDGATILARIQTAAGTEGEVGLPVANIARIDFPEPPQLKTATESLDAGKAEDAASQLAPALAYYAPFRDVAGNWWLPVALADADALSRLRRDREVDALLAETLRLAAGNPGLLRTVKIKQAAAIERRGEHDRALAALDPLLKDTSASPDELLEGWLAAGAAHLAKRNYQESLLAFLRVPVYAPDRAPLLSAALLGSAKAYQGLGDGQRAQAALKELVASYPNAPETAEAKELLRKLSS